LGERGHRRAKKIALFRARAKLYFRLL